MALEGGAGCGIAPSPLPVGAAARLAIRPEHVVLAAATPGAAGLRGRLGQLVFNGASTALIVELPGGSVLRANVATRSALAALGPGADVVASWVAEEAIVFPAGPL